MTKGRKLVLVRHGESTWNQENRFSGWRDVPLSERGIQQARDAGQVLKSDGIPFHVAFTSYLRRAIETLWIILEALDQMWVPEHKHWRLNERHYGKLQGLSKTEMAKLYGDQQVQSWRRGWDVRPPLIEETSDADYPIHQRQYADIKADVPRGESLKDTVERVVPYWETTISPYLKHNRNVLVVAHGNSLRALVKVVKNISDDEITKLEIPTGAPYIIQLDASLHAVESGFRGDATRIAAAIQAVKDQGKAQ